MKTIAIVGAGITGLTAAFRLQERGLAIQLRLGRDPWMRPYTDQTLTRLGESGVKKLLVICPAFVADCLETLEEIALRGRETFLAAGGESLTLIPCLNDQPLWLDALSKMVEHEFALGESLECAR